MPRAKGGFKTRQRRRRILKHAKGFYGRRSKSFTIAIEAVHRAWAYAYQGRKKRKSDFRALWITRINAGVRQFGMSYNKFISGLKSLSVELDRKVLSDMAINDPGAFKALVDRVLQLKPQAQ